MGTKNEPGQFDCLSRAEPDEPMFTLLARDPTAPLLVLMWCLVREAMGGTSPEQLGEARDCVQAMETWALEHGRDLGGAYAAWAKVVAALAPGVVASCSRCQHLDAAWFRRTAAQLNARAQVLEALAAEPARQSLASA